MAKVSANENKAPLMNAPATSLCTNTKAHEASHQRKRVAAEMGNDHRCEERESKRSRFQAWFEAPAKVLSVLSNSIFIKSQTQPADLQRPEKVQLQAREEYEAPRPVKSRVVPSSSGSRAVPSGSSTSLAQEQSSSHFHAQPTQAPPGASTQVRFAEPEASGLLDLLQIQPHSEIDFSRENAVTLSIKNVSTGFVAFKFKASSCMCLARPSRGTLEPSEVQRIRLSLASALDGKAVKEQYLVQAIAVKSSAVLSRDEWTAMSSKSLRELRLPAVRQIVEARTVEPLSPSASPQELQAKLLFEKTACGAEAWLTLRNAASAEIAFRLQAPSGPFTATPSTGRLKAFAHGSIHIRWVGTHSAFVTRSFLLQTIPLQSAGIANFESWAKLPSDLIQDQWLQAELEP
jgi:hypothetical protein